MAAVLRDTGRDVVGHAFHHAEPAVEDCPARIAFGEETYRRRKKTPNTIATLFGPIELSRCVYECLEAGEACLWPLELRLGVVAGLATPALAERVGRWSADHEQEAVRSLLQAEHGVSWSVPSVRKVAAAVRDGVAAPGEAARVKRVVELLTAAEKSPGKHRPTLAAGRDGVMVPIRGRGYQEAATGTVSVLDRRGRRLGTVYFGQMPESGQHRLTAQMSAALTAIVAGWHALGGVCPRLHYLTDGGHHPREFFRRVLRRLADPWRPGQFLQWQWTVDFFHACTHLWTVAESLFGPSRQSRAWYRRMRHWLRHRNGGVADVLRSASQHANRRRLSAARRQEFDQAYRYLRRHARWMPYAVSKRARLPIGSGVTEAACKTVFAERLKRSGMTWGVAGGQVIVDLRVLVLSGVWERSYQEYLQDRPMPLEASYQRPARQTPRIAA
ncbi:MAG TPA: hypothetical protein VGI49_17345 [Mycobacterium sp.]